MQLDPISIPAHLPEPLYRQVLVAAAIAREQLLDLHVRFGMELVERARAIVPPSRAVEIYVRLHQLGDADARALRQRLFAILGREMLQERGEARGGDEAAWETPSSLVPIVRRRLRGRVHLELRDWVEHHTARAELSLLEVHVDHAVRFVRILRPILSYAEVVELYGDALDVPANRRELVYLHAVDRTAAPEPVAASPAPSRERRRQLRGLGLLRVREHYG